MKIERAELAFLISGRDESARYSWDTNRHIVRATLMTLASDSTPRNISPSYIDGTIGLGDISIVQNINGEWAKSGDRGVAEVHFGGTANIGMGLREMVEAGKVAAKIQRGLDKAEREYGHVSQISQLTARVAAILGVKTFLRQLDHATTYSEGQYQFYDVVGAAEWLTAEVNDYVASRQAVTA